MKKLTLLLPFLLLFPLVIFAQETETDGFDLSQLLVGLTTVVTYLAAFIANRLKTANTIILAVVIPITGAIASFLLNLVTEDTNVLLGFAISLISTFLYELQRQLTKGDRTN